MVWLGGWFWVVIQKIKVSMPEEESTRMQISCTTQNVRGHNGGENGPLNAVSETCNSRVIQKIKSVNARKKRARGCRSLAQRKNVERKDTTAAKMVPLQCVSETCNSRDPKKCNAKRSRDAEVWGCFLCFVVVCVGVDLLHNADVRGARRRKWFLFNAVSETCNSRVIQKTKSANAKRNRAR
ncbi:hypothetical protein J6590_005072 [Homalodisca vitripennis]|nr:hypothetical protein J6590_005072 [Homalodisca vitripennis]